MFEESQGKQVAYHVESRLIEASPLTQVSGGSRPTGLCHTCQERRHKTQIVAQVDTVPVGAGKPDSNKSTKQSTREQETYLFPTVMLNFTRMGWLLYFQNQCFVWSSCVFQQFTNSNSCLPRVSWKGERRDRGMNERDETMNGK